MASWLWIKGVLLCQALFLLTGSVTLGAALLLVPEPHRGGRFFLSLITVLCAEAATFGWIILLTMGRSQGSAPAPRAVGFGKVVLLYDLLVLGLVYVALHQLVSNTLLVILHAAAGLLFTLGFGLFTVTNLRARAVHADVTSRAAAAVDLAGQAGQAVAQIGRLLPAASWAELLRAARALEEDLRYAATGRGGEGLGRQIERALRDLNHRVDREPAASEAPALLERVTELRQLVKEREGQVGRST